MLFSIKHCSLALLLAGSATAAIAQNAPPLKPGLWQMHQELQGEDAQRMAEMQQQMKNMPPEMRQQMQAHMKQSGIDMSAGNGDIRMCMTRESMEKNDWQGQQGSCKTDVLNRSATSWKWKSVCTQPPSEIEGEAQFKNDESYTVKTVMKSSASPEPRRMTINGKWLGANCGDLKPLQIPKR